MPEWKAADGKTIIEVDEKTVARARAMLLGVAERADDIRPLHEAVLPYFQDASQQAFEQEGPGWEPLAEGTEFWKEYMDYPSTILQATGDLMNAITTMAYGEDERHGRRDALYFGTEVPYGFIHQYGAPGAGIPARPFAKLPEVGSREFDDLQAAMVTYIVDGEIER